MFFIYVHIFFMYKGFLIGKTIVDRRNVKGGIWNEKSKNKQNE